MFLNNIYFIDSVYISCYIFYIDIFAETDTDVFAMWDVIEVDLLDEEGEHLFLINWLILEGYLVDVFRVETGYMV